MVINQKKSCGYCSIKKNANQLCMQRSQLKWPHLIYILYAILPFLILVSSSCGTGIGESNEKYEQKHQFFLLLILIIADSSKITLLLHTEYELLAKFTILPYRFCISIGEW